MKPSGLPGTRSLYRLTNRALAQICAFPRTLASLRGTSPVRLAARCRFTDFGEPLPIVVMHTKLTPSSELLLYSLQSALVASVIARDRMMTPSPIPESIKNSSEKVLVKFDYWGHQEL
jgi:hypothetical protein